MEEENTKISAEDLDFLKSKLRDSITDRKVLRWAKIYNLLQWKWPNPETGKPDEVPRMDEIRDQAESLIDSLEPNHTHFVCEFNGLRAEYFLTPVLTFSRRMNWTGSVFFTYGLRKVV